MYICIYARSIGKQQLKRARVYSSGNKLESTGKHTAAIHVYTSNHKEYTNSKSGALAKRQEGEVGGFNSSY